jgi:hypothetical protein
VDGNIRARNQPQDAHPVTHWPPRLVITEEERKLLDYLSCPDVGLLPSSLRCPITHELILEPAVVNGHCFEREGIQQWLSNHREDPVGRQPCTVADLRPGARLFVSFFLYLVKERESMVFCVLKAISSFYVHIFFLSPMPCEQ